MKKGYEDLKTRFCTFPPDVQILHAVSDLLKAKHLADVDRNTAVKHVYRSMILLDYIVQDFRWTSKVRELLRLREAMGSWIFHAEPFTDLDGLIASTVLMESTAYRIYCSGLKGTENSNGVIFEEKGLIKCQM